MTDHENNLQMATYAFSLAGHTNRDEIEKALARLPKKLVHALAALGERLDDLNSLKKWWEGEVRHIGPVYREKYAELKRREEAGAYPYRESYRQFRGPAAKRHNSAILVP